MDAASLRKVPWLRGLPLLAALAFAILLAGCGDPDVTRATPEGEESAETDSAAEPPGEEERPEAVDSDPPPANGGGALGADTGNEPINPEPAYIGYWVTDPELCDLPADEQPMEITEASFGGYDEACSFAEVAEVEPNRWEAQLQCDDATEPRRITMSSDRDVLTVTYHDLEDQNVNYRRCVLEP